LALAGVPGGVALNALAEVLVAGDSLGSFNLFVLN
jgi:hypothetical protein